MRINKRNKMFKNVHIFVYIALNIILILKVGAEEEEDNIAMKDLILDLEQKLKLDQFSELMHEELTHDYMKTEIYLIKWLRAADFDVQRARTMLENHLDWRATNKMDTILEENFDYLSSEYVIDTDGVDRHGAPVFAIEVGDWDIRKVILAGQTQKFYRYSLARTEDAVTKLRRAQTEGFNVTRLQVLVNVKGFNIVQHACPQCLPVQMRFIDDFNNHYPGIIDKIIYVNAPASFQFAVRILLPLGTPELQRSVKIFGTDRRDWQEYLYNLISPEELSTSFGGKRRLIKDL